MSPEGNMVFAIVIAMTAAMAGSLIVQLVMR